MRPGGVPKPLDRLVGRAREITAIEQVLRASRLVTLTGIGGSGKTRLALEIGGRAQESGIDVVFVDLAPLRDPGLVPDTVARALGLVEASDDPPETRVLSAVSRWDVLLVIDNLEHVLACRPFIERLLAGAGGVRVLATSRVPLGITGEHEYRVGGLALPVGASVADVVESPACSLFVTRAAEIGVDVAGPEHASSIAALCRRVDGLPLAIELAARRTRVLSPSAILSRLASGEAVLVDPGRAERQSSIDGVIGWSVGLLSANERQCLRKVAVYAGGFDVEAAAAITGEPDVVAALERLIELGLVVAAQGLGVTRRFDLPESIRTYALRGLEVSGELESTRERHALYFLQLAEQMDAAQHDRTSGDWQRRLTAEIDNVRAALDHAMASGNGELAQRLAAAMLLTWLSGGFMQEGRERLEAALALSDAPSVARSRALAALAGLLVYLAGPGPARERAREALYVADLINDPAARLLAMAKLAVVVGFTDLDESAQLFKEAAELADTLGDQATGLSAAGNLASVRMDQGHLDEAALLFDDVIRRAETRDDTFTAGMAHGNVAEMCLRRNDLEGARRHAGIAVRQLASLARNPHLAWVLSLAAIIEVRAHELGAAWSLLGRSAEMVDASEAQERIPAVLAAAAELFLAVGSAWEGAQAWGALKRAWEDLGIPPEPLHAERAPVVEARLRSALGPTRFELAVAEGRRRGPYELVREVRAILAGPLPSGASRHPTRPLDQLTTREREVLALLADGCSDGEIARRLYISPKTASVHVANIKGKLGADSRVHLALLARERLDPAGS